MPASHDLSRLIDSNLASELERIEFVDWDEDHVSLLLVSTLRNTLRNLGSLSDSQRFHSYGSESRSEPQYYFQVEAYKATGALEQRHGDIAIVVQDVDLHRTGTGFYEAKAEGTHGDFPAFDMRQLRRLSSAAPQLALLLYRRTPGPIVEDEYSLANKLDRGGPPTGRIGVVGANVAKRYSRPDWIPDIPQSFGHHFVGRYLTGRDLDYSRNPQLAIKRWLKVTRRAAPVVVSIVISRTPAHSEKPMQFALPDSEPIPTLQPYLRVASAA